MTGWYPMDGHTPGDGDASREDLDDERAGITFPGHDAGVTDEPCTPTNPCRSCRERMTAKDAPIEPARPVEDRDEPVGPYAPTRNGPTLDRAGNLSYPNPVGVASAVIISGRIDALIEVLHLHETALKNRFGQIETTLGDLTHHVTSGAECKVDHQALTDQAFEFGRQQGDADRAARGQSEYNRGFSEGIASMQESAQKGDSYRRGLEDGERKGYDRGVADGRASISNLAKLECPIDHEYLEENLRKNEFVRGLNVGKAEREAELLEQGWTPPGAVHELEVSAGPTDDDLWETALQTAGSQRNRRELETETVRADAVWFYRELKAGPPPDLIDPADQAQETRAAYQPTAEDLF